MRKGFLLVVFLSIVSLAKAQEKFTLQQCIDYALINSITLKNSELDKRVTKAKIQEIVGMGLPQLNATGGLSYYPKLQRLFSTYNSSSNGLSFITDDVAQQLGVNNGDVIALKNPFQLQGYGIATLEATQILVNGNYFIGLSAIKTYKELAQKNYDQARQQVVQQVTKAFYQVLINQEQNKMFESNIARVDTLLRNTGQLYKNGFAEEIDVNRIEVSKNNLSNEYERFKALSVLSVDMLKNLINYPMEQVLAVEGNLDELKMQTVDAVSGDWDYHTRPDYKLMEVNKKFQEISIKNKVATGMPSIQAFYQYGFNTQSPDVGGLFKTKASFKDNGLVGPDKWYSYQQYGVRFSFTLFNGLQRHSQIQQEKLKLLQLENSMKAMRNGIALETKQADIQLQYAFNALNVQQKNMDLAKKVARITKIKYEQGVGSNLEVVQAENDFQTAQVNYYTALYNVLNAKVDREKAYGITK